MGIGREPRQTLSITFSEPIAFEVSVRLFSRTEDYSEQQCSDTAMYV